MGNHENGKDQKGGGHDLHALVESALNHELTHDEISELNRILPENEEACRYFIEMQMLNDRLAQKLAGEEASVIVPFVEKTPVKRNYKPWFMGSAAAVAAVLLVMGLYTILVPKPAFQVVQSTVKGGVYQAGQELKDGTHLSFELGSLQLRNADGLDMVITGPADVELHDSGAITVNQASLYTISGGDTLLIKTASGELRNLGTTYGVQQKENGETRLDVFEGSVEITRENQEPLALAGGVAGVFSNKTWPPAEEKADRSRYTLNPHSGFAVNFRHKDAQPISGDVPFQASWAEATKPRGFLVPPGTGVGVEWLGQSLHLREGSVEDKLKPYASHLRCYLDRRTRDPLYREMKLDETKHGAGIRLSGLNGWYKRMGAKGYRLIVLRAGSRSNYVFTPLSIHAGGTADGNLLGTFPVLDSKSVILPGAEEHLGGRIADQEIPLTLTNDRILLTVPPQSGDLNQPRSNIAAVIVEPVFE
ncbi:FecR family protein [Rubritalea squalenifaciens DSM 18772]|uniref:FecR family protein n=1 Tax=Rubritalea squalenifaciens DSM 18772 TaxID=1123071 RepID=A0A1M6LHN8_9BACT|nr:FecR domain-containing protein [Rubritalea squalenifaciens]SHJ70711.1 FecR family protein [Rubritalea squalenifaciens DSM 18772]